jgi:hypothetical protein
MQRRVRHYSTVQEYFRAAHPEFNWTFSIAKTAQEHWGYSAEDARIHQDRVVEIALKNAKKRDKAKGV